MNNNTNNQDVRAFHDKFGIENPKEPCQLTTDVSEFRVKFMQEELDEYVEATSLGDVEGQIDALVDLVYVALGTAALQGFDWQAHWDEVQRANMSKVRSTGADDPRTKRKHALDVVKPSGWKGPDHVKVFDEKY